MTTASAATLSKHAHDLATAFQARLIESEQLQPHEGLAVPHLRVALVGTIIDETTYAVALHELGHLAAAFGSLRLAAVVAADLDSVKRIEEAAAWDWARHYALEWTAPMEAVRQYAEGTYAARPTPTPQAPAAPSIDWSKWR